MLCLVCFCSFVCLFSFTIYFCSFIHLVSAVLPGHTDQITFSHGSRFVQLEISFLLSLIILTVINPSPFTKTLTHPLACIYWLRDRAEGGAGGLYSTLPTPATFRISESLRITKLFFRNSTICFDENLKSDIYVEGLLDAKHSNTFDFFFGLSLGQRLFSYTDDNQKPHSKRKCQLLVRNEWLVLQKKSCRRYDVI